MFARAPGDALRVTASAACLPMPWPNGGGITRDLALVRAVSGAPGPVFDWRLSLADIDRDGPFSRIEGVDRVFAPIDGTVVLRFADRSVEVGPDDEPLCFDGEAAPDAALPAGTPCRALNLMLARGRATGATRRLALADAEVLDGVWVAACLPGAPGAPGDPSLVRACFVLNGRIAVGMRVASAGDLVEFSAACPAPRAIGSTRLLDIAIRCEPLPTADPGPSPSHPARP
jgi:uncharacterized protein